MSALIERVARALAEHGGWDAWDTAIGCNDTPNGNRPDEERDYWRDLAKVAIDAISVEPIPYRITPAGREHLDGKASGE